MDVEIVSRGGPFNHYFVTVDTIKENWQAWSSFDGLPVQIKTRDQLLEEHETQAAEEGLRQAASDILAVFPAAYPRILQLFGAAFALDSPMALQSAI
ncbi:hypothetical protein NHQ30_009503 [Ciborinia camelliae]|nr:hypothetical protein NHQ30_009503 [Ciborinia camelliae]